MSVSSPTPTAAALLDLLIEAERASQAFHLRLMRMFAQQPEAQAIWWKMATDEALHK